MTAVRNFRIGAIMRGDAQASRRSERQNNLAEVPVCRHVRECVGSLREQRDHLQ